MAFQISEVTSESEYQEIVSAELTSFESPPSAYRTLFYPKTDTNPEARVKAIEGGTARVIQSQRSKPYQRWVKAVDPESGKVVGAAEWRFFESDPYTGVSLPKANWWPEGEEKEFTTSY
ncbi:hypothetical protein OCU04_008037 [Sclerotinia nivalis]|uniref:N-acetyltransferase domain-containing protein n=1 Tax=Sclerotinia nivalis TaxID=352851 RepID=A0A9X0AH80_9HELO|nr:hypothetical protein OCU04_008037 [Sclerotinia nivalis]